MTSVKDLIRKTLNRIDQENDAAYNTPIDTDCGHTVNGYTSTLLVAGAKVGMSHKALRLCIPCATAIYDSSHENHKTVKSLIRKRISL